MGTKSAYGGPSVDQLARDFLAAHKREPGSHVFVEDNRRRNDDVIDCRQSAHDYLQTIERDFRTRQGTVSDLNISLLRPDGRYFAGRLEKSRQIIWSANPHLAQPIPFENKKYWQEILREAGIKTLPVWSEVTM
jgi:hypothetical protein